MDVARGSVGVALGLLSLVTFYVRPAHAGLSGDAASILADQAFLHGTDTLTHFPRFDVHAISIESGVVVHEFLSPSGKVFAISWQGPVMPDLHQLLGPHFDAYSTALGALAQPGLKRSLRIETAGLVFENAGHLRAFSGHAYVPALLPLGVAPRDLPW